ncbi:MAG: TIR domain-containing protein [Verrucomicrobia bacterium]|nr:TIR domain-containing protein [Verrucomicrobiota bacterium]
MPEVPPAPPFSSRAVFLSYAHDDASAARSIADALRGAGVEVWFDESELRGGDAWDAKIKQQIRDCALFLPVISQSTQRRREGYFRLEWLLAEERSRLIAKGTPFLVPVAIDDTAERAALVPEAFLAVQWTRLPEGTPTPQFIERVKSLLDGSPSDVGRDRRTPPSSEPAVFGDAALQPKVGRRVPAAAWVGAIAVIAIAASLWLRRPASENPQPPDLRRDASATTIASTDKSIAVLPFTNLSDDKENTAFFSDGMHEDILTTLANIPELRVISRTSVMRLA